MLGKFYFRHETPDGQASSHCSLGPLVVTVIDDATLSVASFPFFPFSVPIAFPITLSPFPYETRQITLTFVSSCRHLQP